MNKVLVALAVTTCLSSMAFAQEEIVVAKPFIHDRSVVTIEGELTIGASAEPIYKQVIGLLPSGWNLAFTEQRLAIAPISWKKGEQWTQVLDRWGKLNGANVMIDGQRKHVVASPEQDKRPPGLVFVYSGNELHQELYQPGERYKEAEQYVFNRLRSLQGTIHDEVTLHEAQARLVALVNDVDSKEQALADAGKDAYIERSSKPLQWIKDGNYEEQERTGRIRFTMTKGRLMPQLKELATHLPKVIVASGWWQWDASENYEWPNDVTLEARSTDELMLRMVKSYKLTMEVKGNGVVNVYE